MNRTSEDGEEHDTLATTTSTRTKATTSTTLNRRPLRSFLWGELRQEAGLILMGSIAMIASSLSNQAFPRLLGRFMDPLSSTSIGIPGNNRDIWLYVVVLGGGLASMIRTTAFEVAESRIAMRLRQEVFRSLLLCKEITWFQKEHRALSIHEDDDEKGDESINRQLNKTKTTMTTVIPKGLSPAALNDILREDVDRVAKTLTVTVANSLRNTSSVVLSTCQMLSLNPSLFGVALTVVPAVGAVAMVLRKATQRTTAQQRGMATTTASFVEERLNHIAMVKLSNRQEDELQWYSTLQQDNLKLSRRAAIQSGCFMGFLFAASASALFMVMHVGRNAVAGGKMTSGQLTSFTTYSFLLGLGTSGIVKSMGEWMQGMVSATRLYHLLDVTQSAAPVENSHLEKSQDLATKAYQSSPEDQPCNGMVSIHSQEDEVCVDTIDSIRLDSVSFRYHPESPDVLRNVSISLSRGEVVALVGRNGSGKSTTVSLLAGLLRPSAGIVELSDGTNWSLVSQTTKKRLVQVVLQSTALFNTSILENVRYSKPDATLEEVQAALQQANCTSFVERLGMEFVVGLNGCQLSGGERQRLALARALLSDPAFLILDEPLAGLDAAGENAVADAIRQLDSRRGVLLVTHQAKSLALADVIHVLQNGAIVESGTYDELRSKSNSYLRQLLPDVSLDSQ